LSEGFAVTEEQAFLSAIMANLDDRTAKLVYADWLADRDDSRAEILRLMVKVAAQEDGWIVARERLIELEKTAPVRWLAQLDGPVWCVAGNIIESRPFGPLRRGNTARHAPLQAEREGVPRGRVARVLDSREPRGFHG
jgi:uncharacterized protein (TIGR02996 family)